MRMLNFCLVFKEEDGKKKSVGEMLVERLPVFVQSADLEVQERVSDSCQSCYRSYILCLLAMDN